MAEMGQYFGIEGSFRTRETIEKSVFITTLVRVETPEEASAELKRLRAEFSDATHNCYAYVVGEYKKSSDDGEPQGTAGRPMAQVLEMRGCDYMLAVVTRYFGGVKLGAAGLVSAYSGCVARALDKAALKKYVSGIFFTVCVPYSLAGAAEKALAAAGAAVNARSWESEARFEAAVAEEKFQGVIKMLADATSGRASVKEGRKGYFACKE